VKRPPGPATDAWFAARRARWAAQLPTRQSLEQVRWLAPVAHHLADAGLWRLRSEAVARGVAIGTFWAFAVPFAQIVLAAVHCIWWRGNIPVAAAITFVTNPFTVGFWLYLGYRVGSWVVPGAAPDIGNLSDAATIMQMLQAYGWPTLVGMGLFATVGAALGYAVVRTGGLLWFHWRYRSAQAKRRTRSRPA
jgi:uncharacterized protein